MALFTTTTANNCTVQRCESNQTDSVHDNYYFEVTDANELSYGWIDNDLVEDATAAQIKTAITDYLKTIEKLPIPPVKSIAPDSGSVIGSKVTDIS